MKNNGQTTEDNRDSGVLSNPLSFLRSGSFYWDDAGLYSRGNGGDCWSLRSVDVTSSGRMYFHSTYLASSGHEAHGYGNAVRCVSLAPDSICPKGWQLPTYTGDKSFYTLINTSYSMNKADSDSRDSGVLSNPLSLLRSGRFDWYGAGLSSRGGNGSYWSLRSANTTYSNLLAFYNTYLLPQYYNDRGNGFAVRRLSILRNKSFTTLINSSYSMKKSGETTEDNRDAGLLSNPLSFLRGGYYVWYVASQNSRGTHSLYWLSLSYDGTNTHDLYFHNTSINFNSVDTHGFGVAVRCVQILHYSH